MAQQNNSIPTFADLFEMLIPIAVAQGMETFVGLRRSLPIDEKLESEQSPEQREETIQKLKNYLHNPLNVVYRCINDGSIDEAVDQLALKFKLKPSKKEIEEVCPSIDINSKIQLVDEDVLRLIKNGDDGIQLCFISENERKHLDINFEQANGIEKVIKAYPSYATPRHFDFMNDEEKLSLTHFLWKTGVVKIIND